MKYPVANMSKATLNDTRKLLVILILILQARWYSCHSTSTVIQRTKRWNYVTQNTT